MVPYFQKTQRVGKGIESLNINFKKNQKHNSEGANESVVYSVGKNFLKFDLVLNLLEDRIYKTSNHGM